MNLTIKLVLTWGMFLLCFFPHSVLAGPCKNVLIYYTSWSKYDSPAYNYSSIPYNEITHIAYAFITPNADGSLDIPTDYMGADGVHYDGVSMVAAAHAAGVKVLLSCGGSGSTVDSNYTTLAASSSTINTFASNLLAYCQANGFDGVDIDWEYPNTTATSIEFDNLLAGIRAQMPSPQWLLSAALSADSYEPTFLNIGVINNYLSFFNLMCYDYHGSWLTHSGDNAPLLEDSQDPAFDHTASGVTAVNYYISNGATASKINYGLPFYGYGFNTSGLYQNCGGDCNTTTLTYAQIAPLVGVNWTRNWDSSSDSPNLTYSEGASVISYDDSQSVSIKSYYVLHNLGVGGIFAWSADQDYNGSTQPLLDTMYQVASAGCAPTNTPTVTSTPTWTGTPTSTPTPIVSSTWRINAGGPNYTDHLGNLWIADTDFTGGTAATASGTVGGTLDPTLYASQRYGSNFSYSLNVPAGSYQVTLKFAETYSGDDTVGDRVFNVFINSNEVLDNFDIYAQAGGNTALDEVFNNVTPSAGVITLEFKGTTSVDPNAVVEAIQIIPEPATSTPTPSWTNTVSSTMTPTATATLTSTPSVTSTLSRTSTLTSTVTLTPTLTLSWTPTDTPAGTWTPIATATASWTDSSTYSDTPTPTATLTGTPFLTPTLTYSATLISTSTTTFTQTPTPTVFEQLTDTPTLTLTQTPTSSNTQIWTSTHTPTPTVPTDTPVFTSTWTPTLEEPTNTPILIGCAGVPNWNGDFMAYSVGAKVNYNGEIYQCIETHTSKPNEEPPSVPTLWKDLGSCGETTSTTLSMNPPIVYPNPAISSTIQVELPMTDAMNVKIQFFTVAMREVKNMSVAQVVGNTLTISLVDESGTGLANGLYYVVTQVADQKWLTKVLILR